MSPPLTYVEFAPGAAVQDLVLTYWGFTVRELPWPGFEHVVWPDGCLGIALGLAHGDIVATPLTGPRRTPLTVPVQPETQYWGVRFRPEMGAAFLRRPARMLRDQVGPAHHWLGAERLHTLARRLRDALAPFPPLSHDAEVQRVVALAFDRWLFDSADRTMPPEQAVRDAVKVIVATEGKQSVATIATIVGVSVRHLQRCFKDAVGLTPKEYAMVRRGRHALEQVAFDGERSGGLARVAAETGYADQAHLVRDFQRLMSGAPEHLRMRLAAIEHSALMD